MPSRVQFLTAYEFPLEIEQDFEANGKKAKWALNHPKQWGQEEDSFKIASSSNTGGEMSYGGMGISSAVSDDGKLLAISSMSKIYIYNIAAKELRAEVEGNGLPCFRPSIHNTQSDEQTAKKGEQNDGAETGPSYTILCGVPATDLGKYTSQRGKLILWDFDATGRVLDFSEPIDNAQFATKALESIIPDLISQHEWTKDFIDSGTLKSDFERALYKASAQHRRRHNITFLDARGGDFGSSPFSADGKLLLFHAHGDTTQHGMRPADQLPQIVVWDLATNTEKFRLAGHTDAIMWTGISPSGAHIASVSWDGTMRVYSGLTGEFLWVTENSGRQSWAGAFSPDSKSIVWTSKGGMVVQVHDADDGRVIATFGGTFDRWCRNVAWHPDGQRVVLCGGRHAFVWRPFQDTESSAAIEQHLEVPADKDWRAFVEISAEWALGGRKLVVTIPDRTRLI
ncbi:tricorn protease domain 2-containing protein [Amniculicola lignicola CBS 123094]|uniref:Tricorn protease domain 2-containing protein n=1 Tax=Amniculicola lignicola CBS 123094 TaxID=1392246 RepID=A0A6A5W199_9PLEO|nr:tricorn protease domain 2-containing protein [Amniculicola lignicola CBS 123094]